VEAKEANIPEAIDKENGGCESEAGLLVGLHHMLGPDAGGRQGQEEGVRELDRHGQQLGHCMKGKNVQRKNRN